MSNTTYQQCTKALFMAVAIYMAAYFVEFIAIINLEPTWIRIASLVNLAASIWYFSSLGKWKTLVDEKDVPAVQKLWLSSLLQIVSSIVIMFVSNPGTTILVGLVMLVSFGIAIFGYMGLKDSKTMPEGACAGASLLFWAQIILVVSILMITHLPGALLYIMLLSVLGLHIYGWWRIANA